MKKILELREKAKKQKRKIVLPEGEDKRVIKGASFLAGEGIADVYLLGDISGMQKTAEENSITLDGVNLVYPPDHSEFKDAVNTFYELRKHKGMTPEEAEKVMASNFVFYGAYMTRKGIVDGFVAGASHTTSDVARAAIYFLELDREIGTMSSSFIMELDNCVFGEGGLFVFGDCGIIPYPSARQLAGIAIASSDIFKKLMDVSPRVAMLSFSTKGSASGESIDNVRNALAKIKERRPDILIDGELQADSALVPEVAAIKCKGSEVAGRANVLIFPNLDAGNIAYKLTERLGNARAVGPILQGLNKPCSDLSRGCSWEDVVDASAVTAVRAQR